MGNHSPINTIMFMNSKNQLEYFYIYDYTVEKIFKCTNDWVRSIKYKEWPILFLFY